MSDCTTNPSKDSKTIVHIMWYVSFLSLLWNKPKNRILWLKKRIYSISPIWGSLFRTNAIGISRDGKQTPRTDDPVRSTVLTKDKNGAIQFEQPIPNRSAYLQHLPNHLPLQSVLVHEYYLKPSETLHKRATSATRTSNAQPRSG